jgi:hypothetical protein
MKRGTYPFAIFEIVVPAPRCILEGSRRRWLLCWRGGIAHNSTFCIEFIGHLEEAELADRGGDLQYKGKELGTSSRTGKRVEMQELLGPR